MRKSLPFLILFFLNFAAFSEQQTVDSLLNELKKYDAYQLEIGIKSPTLADSIKSNLLLKLSGEYMLTDLNKSVAYARQSLALAELINYRRGIAKGDNAVGYYFNYSGNSDSAMYYFKKTLRIAEELNDSSLLGTSYNNIGGHYDNLGDYSQALNYYLQGLKIREQLNNKHDLVSSYYNIGNIYMVMNKYSDALNYHHKGLDAAMQSGRPDDIGDAYNAIGNINTNMGNDSEAFMNYNKALKIFLDNDMINNASFLYINMGDLYKQEGKYEEALKDYSESIKYSQQAGNNDFLIGACISAGAVYETLGKLDDAEKYISQGLELAKAAGKKDRVKEGYRILAMIYYKQKNYKPAFETERAYAMLYDTIFHEEAQKNITDMKMQYEFDKKEAAAIAAQEKKNLLRNYIYSGLGVVVLFLIILLIQRNRLAKERRQMALEQERMRISRDLHDDLGSGLTGILMMSEQLQDSSPKELVTNNLERIKKSSRQMVEQMGEIVWAMNTKNDTLENLVGYLSTYARDYCENMDLNQRVQLPEAIPDVQMTGMKRRNVFLVVKESLNNIARHAQATQVSLSMEIHKNDMSITMTDNGKGFDKENTRRFGNGLKNMKSRMEDIKGTYRIESVPSNGTTTTIRFPLI